MEGRSSLIDLVVEGKIVIGGRILSASVGIDNGRIVSVTSPVNAPRADKVIRAGDRELILPGMVDMHVHMRDLAAAQKEDWVTGTSSAAAGGVTLVADMPNSAWRADSLSKLREKLEVANSRSLVDFVVYAAVPRDLEEAEGMKRMVAGFKAYPEDYPRISSLLDRVGDCLLVVHPEDPAVLDEAKSRIPHPEGPEDHAKLRPARAEVKAIRRVHELCAGRSVKLHFTHISTRNSVQLISRLKLEGGLSITCDATIHHMLLDTEVVKAVGWIAKVNPPLRSRSDADAIYSSVKAGLIDAVTSDHAPHSVEEKFSGTYYDVPPGFPGVELVLPLLLTEVLDRRASLGIIERYSRSPAEILGVDKGSISVGMDGDVTIVKVGQEKKIRGEDLKSKAKYTPFEGRTIKVEVRHTLLRGDLIVENGQVIAKPGIGRNVLTYARKIRL